MHKASDYHHVAKALSHIRYEHFNFWLGFPENGSPYLQIQFEAINNDTGLTELQKCRKWLISKHMTSSEVVLTAWMAVQAAILHEAREHFTYKGKRIFGPHIDVDALASVADTTDARKEMKDGP
jgi:hypothetical protein